MSYRPSPRIGALLARAMDYVREVPYQVTVRWVFYRLLQDGWLFEKSDYKRLLGYLSKARKAMWGQWRPDTLADESRAPLLMERTGMYTFHVRGPSFLDPDEWLDRVRTELNCPLDRWITQGTYVEVWFEAAAMEQQFRHYVNENVPLLAFHGDISIPEKWKSAERLYRRWKQLQVPIRICYFGDLDDKGIQIPQSAERDVRRFMNHVMVMDHPLGTPDGELNETSRRMQEGFTFVRMGLNDEHVAQYGIPENPERPGTYQWEGLNDEAARELIGQVNALLDLDAFAGIGEREDNATDQFRSHVEGLDILDLDPPE